MRADGLDADRQLRGDLAVGAPELQQAEDVGLARGPVRRVTRRVVGARRLAKAEHYVDRGGATGLIAARFVPLIPFNAVCYAAGITHVPRPRYAWTTAIGIAPFCIVVTYLGSRLQTVSPSDWRLWALTVGLLGGLMLAHRLLPSPDRERAPER